jgi:hypothetical protein
MNNHLNFGLAPLRTEFPDISTALIHCQDHARGLGYYFKCDRGRKYVDRTFPYAKPRKKLKEGDGTTGTAPKKTDCPFQLRL